MRPADAEFASSYRGYVSLVPETDVLTALEEQVGIFRRVLGSVDRERETFAYAPGKWTIRQVVGHIGDGERVFGFRAYAFSRFDASPLAGFDDHAYVEQSRCADVPLADLVEDFAAVRAANLRMFRALRAEQWTAGGVANGAAITVRALAFVMVGHVRHHLLGFRDRYGVVSSVLHAATTDETTA